MNRETFVFYKKWAEAIKGLPSEIKLEIYESIIEYATTGKVPDLKMTAQIGFNFVKTDIDRDLEKYTKTVEKNKQNGKKGGRPKTQKKPLGFQETQQNPKNLEYDNEYDINVLLEKEPKYKHNNMGEGNFSEENPQTDKPPNAEPSKKVAKKKVSIPSVEEFTTYALDYIEQKKIKGTREEWKPTIETKYEAWKDAGWKDGNGKPIANWKLKIQSTIPFLKPHYGITDNGNNNYHHTSSTQRNAPPTNGVAVSKKISARAILARELAQQNVGNEESRGFGSTP